MTASEEAKPIGKRIASDGRVWLVYEAWRVRCRGIYGNGTNEYLAISGDARTWLRRHEFCKIDVED